MNDVLKKYLIPLASGFLVLAVILFFINPIAPLFLLASLLIQAPIIWFIITNAYRTSYRQRSENRMAQFEKDGDAAKWLAEEIKESNSIGRKYWSKAGNALSVLNRVEALLALGRKPDALALWKGLTPKEVAKEDEKRFAKLRGQLLEE